jgi:glycosyltransferase involved in cell wall biosynthesis
MRDPWSWPIADAWRSSPLWRARLAPALMAWQERLWVRAATGVLATTRELANAMAARYPEAPVTWVPNGVDRELLPSRSADPFPGLAIAHVGSLYGGRNLGPVLTALRVLLDRHPTLDGGVRLRTVGIIEPDKAEQLRRDIAALRLDEYVDIRGPVPRPEALALVARSRLAVVLAQDQDCQVPAKLYESIGMGIATLVVAATDSAAGREARRLGAAVAEPGDVSAIVRVLEAAWAHPAPLHPGPPGAVDYRDLAPSVSAILAGESP